MPKAQRSRACQQCRERRVKCDETPGFCQQCRRLGLNCSGPVQGSVIIDMTDRVAKPRQRKKKDTRTPIVVREDESSAAKSAAIQRSVPDPVEAHSTPSGALQVVVPPNRKLSVDQRTELEADEAIAAIRYQYKLPTMYQPSKAVPEALDLAFVSHFVQLNKSVRSYSPEIPWITHLPNLHEKTSKPALRLSIRAASMAFYATVHRDTTVLVDSFRWYTISLNSQRQSLARLESGVVPTAEEILVPIILSLYEVYAGTTSTSLWAHLAAAAKIIEMRGPSNCTGYAFPLFKAMRVSDAHRAIVFNQPSVFATHDWMTIPFEGQLRNAHQYLADILLVIPDCIALCKMSGSLRSFFSRSIPSNVDISPVRARTLQLIHQLDEWAIRFPHLTTAMSGEIVVSADMESLATSGARSASPDNSTLILPDSFIALTAATYEAIRLILSLLLDKISPQSARSPTDPNSSSSPESSCPNLVDTASMSSKSILDIAAYLESTHPVGFDFMRSVFPVVVVGILGPRAEEQKSARHMLERWGKKRGMAGLTAAWLHA